MIFFVAEKLAMNCICEKSLFFKKKKVAFNVLTNEIPPKQHLIKFLQILIKVKHLEIITSNSSVLLVLCYLNHKVFCHILQTNFLQFNPCILLRLCFTFSPCRIVALSENNITWCFFWVLFTKKALPLNAKFELSVKAIEKTNHLMIRIIGLKNLSIFLEEC